MKSAQSKSASLNEKCGMDAAKVHTTFCFRASMCVCVCIYVEVFNIRTCAIPLEAKPTDSCKEAEEMYICVCEYNKYNSACK